MTTELTLLAWSALFCTLLTFPAIGALTRIPGGFAWGLGNRDRPLGDGLPPWAERARRAHMNMVENLAPFAAVVLIAHVAGRNNDLTALGAPGCFGQVSFDVLQLFALGASGQVPFGIFIPNDPFFVGLDLFTQALVFEAVNPLGIVLSDAAAMRIGS